MRVPLHLGLLLLSCSCGKEEVQVEEASAAAGAVETAPATAAEAGPEVLELERGLVVEVASRGKGIGARRGAEVVVHYTARIKDSAQPFDSSWSRGVPDIWRLSTRGSPRLIEGLVLGLEGLAAGSRATLRIPAALGWGETGNPSAGVPPGSDLVYEVTLLEVR